MNHDNERKIMGRQLNFFMDDEAQDAFVRFLKDENFIFIDTHGEKVESIDYSKRFHYLIKESYGMLLKHPIRKNDVDALKGLVIEYKNTFVIDDEKLIQGGRVWIESSYFDDNGEQISKDKDFIKDYEKICRWIRKNVPRKGFHYLNIRQEDYIRKEYINDKLVMLVDNGYVLEY